MGDVMPLMMLAAMSETDESRLLWFVGRRHGGGRGVVVGAVEQVDNRPGD
jgi:hypothetical protein